MEPVSWPNWDLFSKKIHCHYELITCSTCAFAVHKILFLPFSYYFCFYIISCCVASESAISHLVALKHFVLIQMYVLQLLCVYEFFIEEQFYPSVCLFLSVLFPNVVLYRAVGLAASSVKPQGPCQSNEMAM